MSYPYPQDRNRDRKEKGEQPYKDARQAMSQNDASIQAEAEAFGEANPAESDGAHVADLEAEAEVRLREIGEERARAAAADSEI